MLGAPSGILVPSNQSIMIDFRSFRTKLCWNKYHSHHFVCVNPFESLVADNYCENMNVTRGN